MIELLSTKTELPPEVVFRSLTQGYFSNEAKAVKEALDEVLPPGIDFTTYAKELEQSDSYATLKSTIRVDL